MSVCVREGRAGGACRADSDILSLGDSSSAAASLRGMVADTTS